MSCVLTAAGRVADELGPDAAIEAADVVLMTDAISCLPTAIRIARQNIVLALSVKGVLLVLGALGLASMWAAVFGDVGVMVIAVLNATRALRVPTAFQAE